MSEGWGGGVLRGPGIISCRCARAKKEGSGGRGREGGGDRERERERETETFAETFAAVQGSPRPLIEGKLSSSPPPGPLAKGGGGGERDGERGAEGGTAAGQRAPRIVRRAREGNRRERVKHAHIKT